LSVRGGECHLPSVEPGQAGQRRGGQAAPDLGEPSQGGTFHRCAHAGDAVAARHCFDGAAHHGQKAYVMAGAEVIDGQARVAQARDLGVEFAFDLVPWGAALAQERKTSRTSDGN